MNMNDNGPCKAEERAYIALKAHVLERRSGPGMRLDADMLARDLSADHDATLSALILLAIEKLIDFRPGEGFFTKVPSQRECRSLYLYNGALLAASLRNAVRHPAILNDVRNEWIDSQLNPDLDDGEAGARYAETLFVAIGRLSGNSFILDAIVETNARLHAFRRSEAVVFDDCVESLSSMHNLLKACWFLELIAAIEKFHRRRAARVRDIIRAERIYRGAESAVTGKVAPLLSEYHKLEGGDVHPFRDR